MFLIWNNERISRMIKIKVFIRNKIIKEHLPEIILIVSILH